MHRALALAALLLAMAACAGPQGSAAGPATGGGEARSKETAPTARKCRGPNDPPLPQPFGDDDMLEVGRKLAASCLGGRWLASFRSEKKRAPALRFYPMRNRTMMHLDLRRITKEVETALSREGKVTLVADPETAGDVRAERPARQQGQEVGADLIFTGWITQITEAMSDTATAHGFIVAAELLRVDDSRKVWIETVTIKKVVETLPLCPEPAPARR